MAVPSLPENFGNYAIRGIEEVVAPAPVSWLPTTIGWKVLAVCGLALAVWIGLRGLRRWQRNRYRRDAIKQLDNLADRPSDERLSGIAVLLKSTALTAWPRCEVAPLHGEPWVAWLEEAGAGFSQSSRSLLSRGQYLRPAAEDPRELETLSSEAAAWIRTHCGARR